MPRETGRHDAQAASDRTLPQTLRVHRGIEWHVGGRARVLKVQHRCDLAILLQSWNRPLHGDACITVCADEQPRLDGHVLGAQGQFVSEQRGVRVIGAGLHFVPSTVELRVSNLRLASHLPSDIDAHWESRLTRQFGHLHEPCTNARFVLGQGGLAGNRSGERKADWCAVSHHGSIPEKSNGATRRDDNLRESKFSPGI